MFRVGGGGGGGGGFHLESYSMGSMNALCSLEWRAMGTVSDTLCT